MGLPVAVESTVCAHQADLDAQFCAEPATIHLVVREPVWGVVGLLTCSDHESIARTTGEVLAEHPATPLCRFATGECWSRDA